MPGDWRNAPLHPVITSSPSATDGQPGSPDVAGLSQPSLDLSSLWYTLVVRPWMTLGIVASDDSARAWRVAQKLMEVAGPSPNAFKAINVLKASSERAAAFIHAVTPSRDRVAAERTRVLLAIDSPLQNPVSIGLLAACDAVLLILELGRSRIPDARRLIELAGPERVLGAVFAVD
jgi:hypothetical protein